MSAPLPLHPWPSDADPVAVNREIFAGALLHITGSPIVAEIGERGRKIAKEYLGTNDPTTAERDMEPAAFRKAGARARRAVVEDEGITKGWEALLTSLGFPLGDMLIDQMRLRVVPSNAVDPGRIIRPLPPHRDSWGSGVSAQINWWMPLYPLAPTRTMVVWPQDFDRPVANTSAEWDFDALMQDRTRTYPVLPETKAPPSTAGNPVLIEPDTLLVFSAAHLHASVRDDSGVTRLGLDTRSVWQADLKSGRGAPDVDGGGKPPRWDMFDRGPKGKLTNAAVT